MQETIRVILADDHPLLRAGLRAVLEDIPDICLVGDTATTDALPRLCAIKQVDVLLLDVTMPGPGLEATLEAMRRDCPQVKVVILSAVAHLTVVQTAVRLGAIGYILKEEAPELIAIAIRTVMGGAAWYSMSVLQDLVTPVEMESVVVADLTERELQVLRGIAQGWPNTRIAHVLNLSEQTIRNYTNHLYNKIGVDSRSNAARWAIKRGLDAMPTSEI